MAVQSNPLALALATLLCTTGIAFDAEAATITYSVTNTSGNTWRYNYTVVNDTLGAPLDEFTIYFDRTLFDSLAVDASPVGWDSLVVQRDLGLPADGFFDSLALGSGIGGGNYLAGFAATVTFLGQGMPGGQPFEIVNPDTLAVLESGSTVQAVPAPASGLLLATGLITVGARLRRRLLHDNPCGHA